MWDMQERFVGGAKEAGAVRPHKNAVHQARSGKPHEWCIVLNTAQAVDQILEGSQFASQRRTRDPVDGEIFLELETA